MAVGEKTAAELREAQLAEFEEDRRAFGWMGAGTASGILAITTFPIVALATLAISAALLLAYKTAGDKIQFSLRSLPDYEFEITGLFQIQVRVMSKVSVVDTWPIAKLASEMGVREISSPGYSASKPQEWAQKIYQAAESTTTTESKPTDTTGIRHAMIKAMNPGTDLLPPELPGTTSEQASKPIPETRRVHQANNPPRPEGSPSRQDVSASASSPTLGESPRWAKAQQGSPESRPVSRRF